MGVLQDRTCELCILGAIQDGLRCTGSLMACCAQASAGGAFAQTHSLLHSASQASCRALIAGGHIHFAQRMAERIFVFPGTSNASGRALRRVFDGTLRMGILPVALFAGGHTYFAQRMAERMGLDPYAVHATFQFSGTPGKRHRLRERLVGTLLQPVCCQSRISWRSDLLLWWPPCSCLSTVN